MNGAALRNGCRPDNRAERQVGIDECARLRHYQIVLFSLVSLKILHVWKTNSTLPWNQHFRHSSSFIVPDREMVHFGTADTHNNPEHDKICDLQRHGGVETCATLFN